MLVIQGYTLIKVMFRELNKGFLFSVLLTILFICESSLVREGLDQLILYGISGPGVSSPLLSAGKGSLVGA